MPAPRGRKPLKIGIVGSRRRASEGDFRLLVAAFSRVYEPGDWIVSGGCYRGADQFAETIAKTLGLREGAGLLVHRPQFKLYPMPDCFFRRNTKIANGVHVLLALPSPDRKGGTEDTITKALFRERVVYLVEGPDSEIFRVSDESLILTLKTAGERAL